MTKIIEYKTREYWEQKWASRGVTIVEKRTFYEDGIPTYILYQLQLCEEDSEMYFV